MSVRAPIGRRVQASPPRLGPLQARGRGTRGRARLLRAVAQPPGSRAWAGPPLAEVAQRLFPATEVLFSPTGSLFPTAVLGRHYGDLLSFIKGNKHKHTHARNLSAPADGCVPGFVAQSPASPSGGFGGCQLWGRECV